MADCKIKRTLRTDPRFKALERKIGCEWKALGILVCLFELGMESWKNCAALYRVENSPDVEIPEIDQLDKSVLIRKIDYELCGFPKELFEFGFAKELENGIYVCGSREHFGWYVDSIASGFYGSEKAKNKRQKERDLKENNNLGSLSKSPPSPDPEATLSPPSPDPEPIILYNTILYSKNKNLIPKGIKEPVQAELVPTPTPSGSSKEAKKTKGQEFIACFKSEFKKKFGTYPALQPKDIGQMSKLGMAYLPFDELKNMVQVFFQMEDKWFETKGYDFETFRNNLSKIKIALHTGESPEQAASKNYLEKVLNSWEQDGKE